MRCAIAVFALFVLFYSNRKPIYDNSPDPDLGFKATLTFVFAIAVFGFGTLASLAVEEPTGIVYALTFALVFAVIPFVAGWIERDPRHT